MEGRLLCAEAKLPLEEHQGEAIRSPRNSRHYAAPELLLGQLSITPKSVYIMNV
jgi:hypothetical protein